MPAAKYASMGAYSGMQQNPNKLRDKNTVLKQQADLNKPQTPMQPANTPGVKTTANPQTPKTYVAPPPTPQPPQQQQLIGQVPPQPSQQAPVQQPQVAKTTVPVAPQSQPQPSTFNPATGTQGANWWQSIPGYQPQWNTTATAIKQAVGALDPSMVPQFNAPMGYRDNLLSGINYLKNPQGQPPASGGGGVPTNDALTDPMYNNPKFPATEMIPRELGGGTPAANEDVDTFNTWVKILGGDSVKSETKWQLWNYLMNMQDRETALGERDQASGIMSGVNTGGPLNDMIMQAAGVVNNQPGAIVPEIDTAQRGAWSGSLMDTLNNPVISDQQAELAKTGIRDAGYRDTNSAIDRMMQDFASRGIQGGMSEEAMARLGMEGDAATNASLRDYDLQRADINRGGLERAQGALGDFVTNDYGQRLAGADLARGGSQSVLNSLVNASNAMYTQDFEKRRALADILLGTQRQPIDMTGIFGTQSALTRGAANAAAAAETKGPSTWEKILGIASPLAGIGSMFI